MHLQLNHLRLIAAWVGASVAMSAEVIAKQQLVMACALRAVSATASGRHKPLNGASLSTSRMLVPVSACLIKRVSAEGPNES